VVFWSEYAPPGMSPILYSIIYNGSYMLPEIVISGIFVYALLKRGILEMNV
jgi:thiamine transporter